MTSDEHEECRRRVKRVAKANYVTGVLVGRGYTGDEIEAFFDEHGERDDIILEEFVLTMPARRVA